jgi:hypothetical protein
MSSKRLSYQDWQNPFPVTPCMAVELAQGRLQNVGMASPSVAVKYYSRSTNVIHTQGMAVLEKRTSFLTQLTNGTLRSQSPHYIKNQHKYNMRTRQLINVHASQIMRLVKGINKKTPLLNEQNKLFTRWHSSLVFVLQASASHNTAPHGTGHTRSAWTCRTKWHAH